MLCNFNDRALLQKADSMLPKRVKDEITHFNHPSTLQELRDLVLRIDQRYWECKAKLTCESGPTPQTDRKFRNKSSKRELANDANWWWRMILPIIVDFWWPGCIGLKGRTRLPRYHLQKWYIACRWWPVTQPRPEDWRKSWLGKVLGWDRDGCLAVMEHKAGIEWVTVRATSGHLRIGPAGRLNSGDTAHLLSPQAWLRSLTKHLPTGLSLRELRRRSKDI